MSELPDDLGITSGAKRAAVVLDGELLPQTLELASIGANDVGLSGDGHVLPVADDGVLRPVEGAVEEAEVVDDDELVVHESDVALRILANGEPVRSQWADLCGGGKREKVKSELT